MWHTGEAVHLNAKELPFVDAVRELADASGPTSSSTSREAAGAEPITATVAAGPLRTGPALAG